jgi:hypothetical protein
MPASTLMRFKDGIYSFDSDPMVDLSEKNILSWMVSSPSSNEDASDALPFVRERCSRNF